MGTCCTLRRALTSVKKITAPKIKMEMLHRRRRHSIAENTFPKRPDGQALTSFENFSSSCRRFCCCYWGTKIGLNTSDDLLVPGHQTQVTSATSRGVFLIKFDRCVRTRPCAWEGYRNRRWLFLKQSAWSDDIPVTFLGEKNDRFTIYVNRIDSFKLGEKYKKDTWFTSECGSPISKRTEPNSPRLKTWHQVGTFCLCFGGRVQSSLRIRLVFLYFYYTLHDYKKRNIPGEVFFSLSVFSTFISLKMSTESEKTTQHSIFFCLLFSFFFGLPIWCWPRLPAGQWVWLRLLNPRSSCPLEAVELATNTLQKRDEWTKELFWCRLDLVVILKINLSWMNRNHKTGNVYRSGRDQPATNCLIYFIFIFREKHLIMFYRIALHCKWRRSRIFKSIVKKEADIAEEYANKWQRARSIRRMQTDLLSRYTIESIFYSISDRYSGRVINE